MTWLKPFDAVVLAAGQASAGTLPYVEAWLSNGAGGYNLGASGFYTKILFDKVNADITSSYAPGTGIFTAPVAGVYQIACGLSTNAVNSVLFLAVYKNGANKKTVLTRTYPDWAVATLSFPLQLAVGDTISIHACNNVGSVAAIPQEQATWLSIAYLRG